MRNVCLSAMFFAALAGLSGTAVAADQSPLVLKKIGNFFVGGEDKSLAPGSDITVNQMYVEYKIPKDGNKVPVIMVHGCCLSSKSWQETPDGRMGWDEYFVRKGHPVYLADQAGRARSGFDAQVFNDVRAGTRPPADLPRVLWADHQFAWRVFRFGPSYGEVWPDEQFPVEHVDQLYKEMIPDLNSLLPSANPTWTNMGKLAVQLGGGVRMGHSESGFFPARAAMLNPAGIKGLLLTEGTCLTTTSATALTPADMATLAKIPTLILWGDHVASEAPGTPFGDCKIYAQLIKDAGGDITFTHLPKMGIFGNSHMFMLDKNNLQVADVILKWLDQHVHR